MLCCSVEEDVFISAINGFGYPVLTQDKISVKQSKDSLAKVIHCFLIPLEPLHIPGFFRLVKTTLVCGIYKPYSEYKISYPGLI